MLTVSHSYSACSLVRICPAARIITQSTSKSGWQLPANDQEHEKSAHRQKVYEGIPPFSFPPFPLLSPFLLIQLLTSLRMRSVQRHGSKVRLTVCFHRVQQKKRYPRWYPQIAARLSPSLTSRNNQTYFWTPLEPYSICPLI